MITKFIVRKKKVLNNFLFLCLYSYIVIDLKLEFLMAFYIYYKVL